MYGIIKNVINAGGYKLADIQYKIKKLYVLGDITEEQMDELLRMASGSVSADAERPETLTMIKKLSERIDDLDSRLNILEGNTEEEPDVGEESTVYPAWEPWDGIADRYQYGAVVRHNDKLWQSIYQGQNVWEPSTAGTESMWIEYNPDGEEATE